MLLTPGSHVGGQPPGQVCSLCVRKRGLVHLMRWLEMGCAAPQRVGRPPRARASACHPVVSRADIRGQEGDMPRKYCERLGWRQEEDPGCSLGTEKQRLETGQRPHKRGRRAGVTSPSFHLLFLLQRGLWGWIWWEAFPPLHPGECHLLEQVLASWPGGQRVLVLKSRPSSSSSDQTESGLFWETHLFPAPARSFLASALCANGTGGAPSPSYLLPFLSICPVLSTPPLHATMLIISILSFEEMRCSEATSTPPRDTLGNASWPRGAFPPLLHQLPPGASRLPQPPELRKWCRAAARAGSHTMVLFNPQMRSHHVTFTASAEQR